jgi:hypothetical protein
MEGAEELFGTMNQGTIMTIVNAGLFFTLAGMAMIGLKAHTKDPGL